MLALFIIIGLPLLMVVAFIVRMRFLEKRERAFILALHGEPQPQQTDNSVALAAALYDFRQKHNL
jgi:hypothetical protein